MSLLINQVMETFIEFELISSKKIDKINLYSKVSN